MRIKIIIGKWKLTIRDLKGHPMMWSERNGYARFIRIGRLGIRLAKKGWLDD